MASYGNSNENKTLKKVLSVLGFDPRFSAPASAHARLDAVSVRPRTNPPPPCFFPFTLSIRLKDRFSLIPMQNTTVRRTTPPALLFHIFYFNSSERPVFTDPHTKHHCTQNYSPPPYFFQFSISIRLQDRFSLDPHA